MNYKLFEYQIFDEEKAVHADKHFKIFEQSVGQDPYGQLTEHRGKRNAVLMYLRKYRSDFTALVGRHSTNRKITTYDQSLDETEQLVVDDDDYPHAPFICLPRLGVFAVVDGSKMSANQAVERIHSIINFRKHLLIHFSPLKEAYDLRKAVKRFAVTEVTFDIFPVNPHTGNLGRSLDKSNKLDHIQKLSGKAGGTKSDPLRLEGGFLTSIQQLQASGHSKVGFIGQTLDGHAEIQVPKPVRTRVLSDDGDKTVDGENVDIRIKFRDLSLKYPFHQSHITAVRTIARHLTKIDPDEE